MSEPIGWNALLGFTAPWKSVTETRVTVPASGSTDLPATPLANRAGVWIWVPGGGGLLRVRVSGGTLDGNSLTAYAGAITPIPATDQVILQGLSSSGSLTVTVWEYVTG